MSKGYGTSDNSYEQNYPRDQPPPYNPYDNQRAATVITHPPGATIQPVIMQQHNVPVVTLAPQQIIVTSILGPDPCRIQCPSCRQSTITRVSYTTGTKTHIWAGILCILGCWPCCLVPYLCDCAKNSDHYCPNCGAYIGSCS